MAAIPQPILDALQTVVDDKDAQASAHAATAAAQTNLDQTTTQANQAIAVAKNGLDQANTAEAAAGEKIATDKQHFEDLFTSFLAGSQS